jgi:hypothetical protein
MRSITVTKSDGFITADNYAVVPWAKRLVIIYNGQQIGDVSTERQANLFIKKHRADNPTGVSKFTK